MSADWWPLGFSSSPTDQQPEEPSTLEAWGKHRINLLWFSDLWLPIGVDRHIRASSSVGLLGSSDLPGNRAKLAGQRVHPVDDEMERASNGGVLDILIDSIHRGDGCSLTDAGREPEPVSHEIAHVLKAARLRFSAKRATLLLRGSERDDTGHDSKCARGRGTRHWGP